MAMYSASLNVFKLSPSNGRFCRQWHWICRVHLRHRVRPEEYCQCRLGSNGHHCWLLLTGWEEYSFGPFIIVDWGLLLRFYYDKCTECYTCTFYINLPLVLLPEEQFVHPWIPGRSCNVQHFLHTSTNVQI